MLQSTLCAYRIFNPNLVIKNWRRAVSFLLMLCNYNEQVTTHTSDSDEYITSNNDKSCRYWYSFYTIRNDNTALRRPTLYSHLLNKTAKKKHNCRITAFSAKGQSWQGPTRVTSQDRTHENLTGRAVNTSVLKYCGCATNARSYGIRLLWEYASVCSKD